MSTRHSGFAFVNMLYSVCPKIFLHRQTLVCLWRCGKTCLLSSKLLHLYQSKTATVPNTSESNMIVYTMPEICICFSSLIGLLWIRNTFTVVKTYPSQHTRPSRILLHYDYNTYHMRCNIERITLRPPYYQWKLSSNMKKHIHIRKLRGRMSLLYFKSKRSFLY